MVKAELKKKTVATMLDNSVKIIRTKPGNIMMQFKIKNFFKFTIKEFK